MLSFKSFPAFALLVFLFSCQLLFPQSAPQTSPANSGCNVPLKVKDRSKSILFTEQQKEWLGEILDSAVRRDFNVIDDPEGHLQKVGESLLAQLPPTKVHYHFTIIDSPELNSFGTTGGRIYIHRRMIAFAQNEDELAAILAHEIGHMVADDIAVEVSDWFNQLGITSIGDRQDLFSKWNRFKDNARKIKTHQSRRDEEDEQVVADRIGLYAVTRAGYDPNGFITFADRLFQTQGKTGGFWSDFFGTTRPEAKRLREILKNRPPLTGCIAPHVDDTGHFARWKQSIIESQRAVAKQELPGLLKKISLQPHLRDDLDYIQFSPDGKYMLAQDSSSIFVLAREPLASLFRIDALDAHTPQFTPDSRAVVFYDKELRVERWDIASQQRNAMHQLSIPDCLQSRLSHSGETLACIDSEFALRIVNVNTDEVLFLKKKFYEPSWRTYWQLIRALREHRTPQIFDMKFSPDDRFFVIGNYDTAFAYDLSTRSEARLPGSVRSVIKGTFAFSSPDELDGIHFGGYRTLVRLRFPSGDKIDEFKFDADGWLSSTPSSNYLLVRPAGTFPVGIVDLKASKITLGFKSPAFAIFGDIFAGEQNSGEIGLFHPGESSVFGRVTLPESPLARSRASAFSSDGKWLALSGGTRGSLWSLESGERVFFTKSFEGALFDNGELIAKFTKNEPNPPRVFALDPANKGTKKLYDVPEDAEHHRVYQTGRLAVTIRPESDKVGQWRITFVNGEILLENATSIVEVRDIHNNNLLWQRKLHGGNPDFFYSGSTLTVTTSSAEDIKAAAKDNVALTARLNGIERKREGLLLVEAFESLTGKPLGSVVVDTGKHSFRVDTVFTLGDFVFVGDYANNRTLVYSLQTGEQKGALIGHIVTATPKGDRVVIENGRGVADMYNTATLQPTAHFGFPSRILSSDFIADGSLMVMTADQNVYHLAPSLADQTASAK